LTRLAIPDGGLPLSDWLKGENAHNDIVEWARPFGEDWERAWNECPRGDWLLAMAARARVDEKRIVLAAAACARQALEHVDPAESRPLRAIETAEAWANGSVSAEACRALATELDRMSVDDPALACAFAAAHAALASIDAPEHAAGAAANAVQSAMMLAADCALMSILSYAQKATASEARAQLPYALIRSAVDSRA
jgi:hypothetical protein